MARHLCFPGLIAAATLAQPAMATDLSEPYKAWGIEPAWQAVIATDRIEIDVRFGTAKATLPYPIIKETETGAIVDLPTIQTRLILTDALCRDIAVGMPHPQTAELHFNGEILRGCAGAPGALLADTKWQVAALNGQPVGGEVSATLDFDLSAKITGDTGCNKFFGEYSIHGEGISLGDLASTKIACPGSLDMQEAAMLSALSQTRRFDFDGDGRLLMIGGPQDTPLLTATPRSE